MDNLIKISEKDFGPIKVVIITAGWRPDGVKKVIEQVDKQTFTNWFHVIVNDNNPELRDYMASINNLEDDPKRVFIDLHKRFNWYGGYSRNIGAQVSFPLWGGDEEKDNIFLAFFDDDNYFSPNHIQSLVDEIEKDNKLLMVGTDMLIRGTINKEYSHLLRCAVIGQNCDLGSFLYSRWAFLNCGGFFPRNQKKIAYDFELIKKMQDSFGEQRVKLIHPEIPTFHFYHKQR